MPADNSLTALRMIRRMGQMVRADLARQMDISLSLASKVTAELIRYGLLREAGRSEALSAGRPSDLLALAPDSGYAIGLDIDAGRYIAVVVNLVGEIIASIDEPAAPASSRKEIIAGLKSITERAAAQSGVAAERIYGLGVGLRRTVDPVTGIAHGWPGVSGWEEAWAEFPVRDALKEVLPYPHIMLDDIVRALGVAEASYGQGTLSEDFIYILADTGIGMAIMLGGAPYIGFSHIAGEIGHISVPGDMTPCACGNTGCLENLASIPSLLRRLGHRLDETQTFSALRWNREQLSIEALLGAAESGDKLTYQLVNDAGEEFGKVISIVINLLGPRLVIVGGLLASSQIYLDAARRMVKLRALEKASRVAVIKPSTLEPLAGARGAATMALNALFDSPEKNILQLSAGRG